MRKASGCRRDARADGQLHALIEQDPFQRIEEQKHIRALAGISHQADAPRRGLDIREPSGDFDIELIQQAGARLCSINALGNVNGGNGRQTVLRGFRTKRRMPIASRPAISAI